jgi:hypothetical protein
MSRKQKIQIIKEEPIYNQPDDDDYEIELKRPIEQPKTVITELQNQPVPVQEEKPKRKKNITEEHKQKIRDNLAYGRELRKQKALEREEQLQFIKDELERQRQDKILMEAEKLRRKHTREMKKIEVNVEDEDEPVIKQPVKPPSIQKPKKSKSIYQSQTQQPSIQPVNPYTQWKFI